MSPANMLTLFHRAELCTFVGNFPSVKMQEKASDAAEASAKAALPARELNKTKTTVKEEEKQRWRRNRRQNEHGQTDAFAGWRICFPASQRPCPVARTLFGRDAFIQDGLL